MFNKKDKANTPSLNHGNIRTIIGEDFELDGNIKSLGTIRIDGKITGDLQVKKGIVIGDKGKIIGNIETELAIIYGEIYGNINAGKLEIKKTGSIHGDIKTDSITMELGAQYNGKLEMKDHASKESLNSLKAQKKEQSNGIKS